MAKQQHKAVTDQSAETITKIPLSRKFIIAGISLAILLVFFLLMKMIIRLNEEPEERGRNANVLGVVVDIAKQEDVQLSVNVQGEARPSIEINLVPEVSGKIVYVSPDFVQGGIFRKGETLLRIEDADYQASVIRAQSAVAQAEQLLVRERAESEIARRDYEELGTGTPSALALREPQRQQAEAALSAANAELDTARLQLERTKVRAPFDGRVRTKEADLGQYVNPGARLGSIFSTDTIEVRLALSDTDLSRLEIPLAYVAKDRASAPDVELSTVIGGQTRYWNGKIMRTDSAYDTQTRALFAIAEVFDPYGKGASEDGVPLAPGLFMDAKITGKIFENVITFRRDGLRPGNEVFVVNEKGVANIRSVTVLDSDKDRAILSSGVIAGELVVLSPMEKSRISTPLQARDVNDMNSVLAKPDERKPEVKEDAPAGFWAKLFPKKEVDPNSLNRQQQKELIEVMSAEYAGVLRAMTEDENDKYRKMTPKEKGEFITKKLVAQSEKSKSDSGKGGARQTLGR